MEVTVRSIHTEDYRSNQIMRNSSEFKCIFVTQNMQDNPITCFVTRINGIKDALQLHTINIPSHIM